MPEPEAQKLEDSKEIFISRCEDKDLEPFAQRNKQYHWRVLLGSLLNAGHTLGFDPHTHKVKQ